MSLILKSYLKSKGYYRDQLRRKKKLSAHGYRQCVEFSFKGGSKSYDGNVINLSSKGIFLLQQGLSKKVLISVLC
jgi:hypothetical protein